MKLPDQKQLWDQKHAAGHHAALQDAPMDFAVDAQKFIPEKAKILDLGCGVGENAFYFAKQGHDITAVDISPVVIEQNKAISHQGNVVFLEADIMQPLQFKDASFDVVFAHLSIHYFLDVDTRAVVQEIFRVLKPGGWFLFRCKSVESEKEKHDCDEVEENVYVSKSTGHVRHLFSEDYSRSILEGLFTIEMLCSTKGSYNDGDAAFIECRARKEL